MDYESLYQQAVKTLSTDTVSSIAALMECYNNHYNQENIRKLLELNFWFSQKEAFRNNYISNIHHFHISIQMPSYEQLPLLFIPINEYIYYYYDKTNNIINGPFDFSPPAFAEDDSAVLYEPALIYYEWNFSLMKDIFSGNKYGAIYVIPESTFNLSAFASMLSLSVISSYYHKYHTIKLYSSFSDFSAALSGNENLPIPQNIYCHSDNSSTEIIKQAVLDIHKQRLANQRHCKPILSICIPTYNRGHLALEKLQNLTASTYDSEISFIISNNGSTVEDKEYRLIEEIAVNDSRILYNRFYTNQQFIGNFWKVLLMSNAEHALLISDEDSLIQSALPHYLGLLLKYPKIGVIRSSDYKWYTPDSQQNALKSAGKDAVLHFFLRNNYMSGIIYLCSVINEKFIADFTHLYNNNEAFKHYPHEFLDMYLCNHFDFLCDNTPLFICGEANLYADALKASGLYEYQTKKSRLLQLKGFVELINTLDNLDDLTLFQLYMIVCYKTFMLLKINYIKDEVWSEVVHECKDCCVNNFSLITFQNHTVDRTAIEQLIDEIASHYH